LSSGFIDEVEIHVAGGRGGDGCVAFRREKYVPFGGPNGGDGGQGGSVILEATPALNTLSPLRHRGLYKAKPGGNGLGKGCHGRSAEDLVIPVPLGTVVRDSATGQILGDLSATGDRLVVAKGGDGGRGNARFATATNRAPRKREPGWPSQERHVHLELKLLADVGLVGLPNAGKSTLISRISAARPKIAAYPFTTLVPNLGVVDWGDFRSFVVADIPGLIEGSHLGEGLGDQFLRHVERTSVILHLVDCSDLGDDPGLLERPRIMLATKLDASTEPERREAVERLARERNVPMLGISSASGLGLDELVRRTGELVQAEKDREAAGEGRVVVHRVMTPLPEPGGDADDAGEDE
jgi:GTP-binding protein